MQDKKRGLFSVFITFFLETLGTTIVFPIFAPLFLAEQNLLLDKSTPFSNKTLLLGFFLAVYPLMQLFFSPVIGVVTDKIGRKRVFLFSIFGTFLGYLGCGFGVLHRSLTLLFLGRVLMGVSGSSTSLCMAALADLSKNYQEKIKLYGLGSGLAGAAFILGPFIGGRLSDPSLLPFFSLDFPLWVGAVLAFFNFVFLYAFFNETLHSSSQKKIKLLDRVKKSIKKRGVKRLYFLFFFYLLSWNTLFQFFPGFMVANFSSTSALIGDFFALFGVFWVIGNITLHRIFLEIFHPKTLLAISSFLFTFFVVLAAYAKNLSLFVGLVAMIAFVASVGFPLCTGSISHLTKKEEQGRLFGLTQSIQSIVFIVAPLIAVPFIQKDSQTAFFISATIGGVYFLLTLFTPIPQNTE